MKLLWITDPHLNFISGVTLKQFFNQINKEEPDAIAITGDIAEGQNIKDYLELILEHVNKPIYFVLGNHDYYNRSIKETRKIVKELSKDKTNDLHWMNVSGVVDLTDDVAIIGHDGWADGRNGDFNKSSVMLNDYYLIEELAEGKGVNSVKRKLKLEQLADEAANYLEKQCLKALKKYKHIIAITHVPPFLQASWHQGNISDWEWAPHFSNAVVGPKLTQVMLKHPDKQLTMLCGHCFDHETELLTENGWKFRSELNNSDLVWTWNKSSNQLQLNKINSFHDHQYSGDMYYVHGRAINLMVTPDHGLIDVSNKEPSFIKAKEFNLLYERQFMNASLKENQDGIDFSNDEIKLLVWIVADGSLERTNLIRFHLKKKRKIHRITQLLDRLKIEYSYNEQKNGNVKINISTYKSYNKIFDTIYWEDKKLPNIIRDANKAQSDIILEEYRNTDGTKASSNCIQIFTNKKHEADLLQHLFVTSNRRCSILKRDSDYILSVTDRTTHKLNRNNLQLVPFDGPVWCVNVDNGTLVVRRKGKACITQNTHSSGVYKPTDNVIVKTGGAKYYSPHVQEILNL